MTGDNRPIPDVRGVIEGKIAQRAERTVRQNHLPVSRQFHTVLQHSGGRRDMALAVAMGFDGENRDQKEHDQKEENIPVNTACHPDPYVSVIYSTIENDKQSFSLRADNVDHL